MRRLFAPWPRRVSGDGHGADRIVAEPNSGVPLCRREALRQHRVDHRARLRREIKFKRGAGVEVEAFENARERVLARRQPKTVVADRAGKHERKTVGAVVEFTQRDFVAERWVRVFDPRQHLPRRRARPRRHRPCGRAALGQRLDRKAVIGRADQALKRRSLEHLIDEVAPRVTGRGRKFGGKQQRFRVRHGCKMPRRARQGQPRKRERLTAAAAFQCRSRPPAQVRPAP